MKMNESKNVEIKIPFSTPKLAALALDVLNVDKEIKRSQTKREFCMEGSNLIVNFYGSDLRGLRVSVNSFFKNLNLILKTIQLTTDHKQS